MHFSLAMHLNERYICCIGSKQTETEDEKVQRNESERASCSLQSRGLQPLQHVACQKSAERTCNDGSTEGSSSGRKDGKVKDLPGARFSGARHCKKKFDFDAFFACNASKRTLYMLHRQQTNGDGR
jgi:hypothetical protein